jgi:hypothetical protein
VWILGQAMFSKLADRPTEAAKGMLFSKVRKGFNESPKSHTIHAMVGLLCGIFHFFFTACQSLLSNAFHILFEKNFDM